MTRLAPAIEEDLDWKDEIQRRGGREFTHGWPPYENIAKELEEQGVEVRPYRIDVEKFHAYVESCGYRELGYWQVYGVEYGQGDWIVLKKCLEHYISIDLTQPREGDVVVDIASCRSPFPDLIAKHYGVRAYRQDHMYPPRLEGDRIGGDAAALPVPDEFADKLTLHCSYEHFEGDRDIRFLEEAARVLKPGGKLCIIPLYTTGNYAIQTDPAWWGQRPLSFDSDALICITKGWGERYGRWYDAENFRSRILDRLDGLDLVVYSVENSHEISPECHLFLTAVLTKPVEASSKAAAASAASPHRSPLELERENKQLLQETAEYRHLLEEAELKIDHLEIDKRNLEVANAAIEEGTAAATQAYEAEIARLQGVIQELLQRD